MSSSDPCACADSNPGYGGMCKTCGKESFRAEEGPAEEPNPYKCYVCGNLALYRIDHKTDCRFYPPNIAFIGRSS